MRSYWLLLALMSALFLALFGVVEALDVAFLTDPGPRLSELGRWGAAAIGLGLLTGDVFLPVPSSLIMVANGALFGIVGGTLLSVAGGLAASAAGFAVGRRGSAVLHRFVPEDERRRTRPVPGPTLRRSRKQSDPWSCLVAHAARSGPA